MLLWSLSLDDRRPEGSSSFLYATTIVSGSVNGDRYLRHTRGQRDKIGVRRQSDHWGRDPLCHSRSKGCLRCFLHSRSSSLTVSGDRVCEEGRFQDAVERPYTLNRTLLCVRSAPQDPPSLDKTASLYVLLFTNRSLMVVRRLLGTHPKASGRDLGWGVWVERDWVSSSPLPVWERTIVCPSTFEPRDSLWLTGDVKLRVNRISSLPESKPRTPSFVLNTSI